MAGRPALVPPRGALQERVSATGAGWIMDGWPSADSILDQLMALTAPENRGELERKSQLAQTAGRDEHDRSDLVTKSYGDVLAETGPTHEHFISRLQIQEATSRALGMVPLGQAADRPPAERTRERVKMGRFFRLFRR